MKPRAALSNVTAYPISGQTRRDKIRLDLNESTRGCSPNVLAALRRITWEDVGAYPEYGQLRTLLASHHQISPEQLLLTNGADDAIRSLMQSYINAGDELVLAEPTFGIIPIHARVMGAELKTVPYDEDLSFPIGGYLAALTRNTRLVAIVRPDSPTGGVIHSDDLRRILAAAPQAIVMLDETYHHFLGESLIKWIDDYPNLVVMQSFSKAYCLAGLRCGFLASAGAIISEVSKVDPPFSLNNLGVIAITAALADKAYLESVVADVASEKSWLLEQLRMRGLTTRETVANFILARFGETAAPVADALAEHGILIKSLDRFPLLKGWCRIAVGTRKEHEQLLAALAQMP